MTRTRFATLHNVFLTAAILALAGLTAQGQVFDPAGQLRGQFRDAAIDTTNGQFFLAVYDRDQIWQIDTQSGEVARRINVGHGPSALAYDGHILACANRLDHTVTLIRLADATVIDTVSVGDGPSAIASLGDGRFIVASAFDNSLSLIDTRGTIAVSAVPDPPAVPVDIAVTTRHVAVVSRADGRLHCYDRASLGKVRAIKLPDGGARVVPGTGDTVIAAGKTTLQLIDIGNGSVRKTAAVDAIDLDASEDTLHVLTQAAYATYGLDLAPKNTTQLPEEAAMVRARGGTVTLLAPRSQSLRTKNLASLIPTAAPAPSATGETAADGDTMVVEEAQPVAQDADPPAPSAPAPADSGAMAVEEAQPADEAPAEPAERDHAPEPPEEDTSTTDTVSSPEAESAAAADAEEEAPPSEAANMADAESPPTSGASVRRNPITKGVRVPSSGRPSASPLHRLSRRTIADALVRPTEFGSTEAGFEAPDLSKPLENIKFSTAKRESSASPTDYADFRAELGDLKMESDSFVHKQDPVEVHARGNVRITQQSSSITAEAIHYSLPSDSDDAEEDGKLVLKGDGAEGGPGMDRGRLTLEKAHIIEPTREMTADQLDYDFRTGKGELTNARGEAGIYYFSADKIHLHGPQTLSGDNVWVTTCDKPDPHYRIRLSDVELVDGKPVAGSNARLQLGGADTPLYLPKWRRGGVGGSPWNIDFDSGRQAGIGSFVNVGQQYEISPDVSLGPRLFPTEKEGVGFGADIAYDFMENPAARLYRTQGEAHGLYTTEDRGYVHWYHRYEYSDDLIVRAQVEHWGDEEFYKDFYYDTFQDRSRPRSFANVTYRKPDYIATGTVRMQSHGWFAQTEQAPEATYHLLERNIANNLYFTFDTVNGYYNREPRGVGGGRSVNTARLTYSWDPHPALAVTPFMQLDASFYTRDRRENNSTGRFGATAGVTAQSRLSRTYGGRWGFSAFKHLIVPSITYSYRPETNLRAPEIPQFDPLDSDFGRSRVELKLANVFYGRDADTGEVWQVGRISLYQGNDFWNETRKTEDYEIEVDVRPRPWWGAQLVGERQVTSDEDSSLGRFSLARNYPRFYELLIGDIFGGVNAQDFSSRFGDYNRILSQIYYDGEARGDKFSGRVGFAYTETQSQVFNREALYGLGYRISDKWGFGFEHVYDLDGDNLRTQTYELRRSLHCWETAIRFHDRESGFDINFEFNIKAFPGSQLKF